MDKVVLARSEALAVKYRDAARQYIEAANNNIRVCAKYNITDDALTAIRITESLSAFVSAYVDAELKQQKGAFRGAILNAMKKEAERAGKFIAAQEIVFLNQPHLKEGAQYSKVTKGDVFITNDESIEAATTEYLPDEYAPDYARHKAAVKALNEFFQGAIEHERELADYFTVGAGGVIDVCFGNVFAPYPPRVTAQAQ